MPVDTAALDVAGDEMARHCIEHARWNLSAGSVVEKNEAVVALQTRKLPADIGYRESRPVHATSLGVDGEIV